jgi:hypothetical protein
MELLWMPTVVAHHRSVHRTLRSDLGYHSPKPAVVLSFSGLQDGRDPARGVTLYELGVGGEFETGPVEPRKERVEAPR